MNLGPIPWHLWLPLLEERRKLVGWTPPENPRELDNIVNWFDPRWIAPQQLLVSPFNSITKRHTIPPSLDKDELKLCFAIPGFEWLPHELGHFLTTDPIYMYEPWWGESIISSQVMSHIERDLSELRIVECVIGEHLGFFYKHLHEYPELNIPKIDNLFYRLKELQFLYPPPSKVT